MKIEVLGKRILVKPKRTDTWKGLFLPETASELRPSLGEVMGTATGSGFRIGQQIIYTPFGGTKTKIGETEYIVLHEDDIAAILTDDGSDELTVDETVEA